MKNIFFKFVVAFIIIAPGFSCNTVTGPTDRNPTLRTITTYQGSWTGTTSQGFPISFTVVGKTITGFQIDILYSVPGKPAEQNTYSSNKTVTIIGSDFTINVYLNSSSNDGFSGGIAAATPVSGHFASTTAAEGTSIPSLGSGVTWKADKK